MQVGVPGPWPAVAPAFGPSEGAVTATVRDAAELLDVRSRIIKLSGVRSGGFYWGKGLCHWNTWEPD
ncbi:hypothetical protein J2W15_001884 [Pseudarthrobacter sulfonivorans]|nr:hypothetical protein [Pseudarthrobacter sulfonivorans]